MRQPHARTHHTQQLGIQDPTHLHDYLVDNCGTLVRAARPCERESCGSMYVTHHNVAVRPVNSQWRLYRVCSRACVERVIKGNNGETTPNSNATTELAQQNQDQAQLAA